VITVLGIDPGDTAGFLLAGWRPGERKAAFARAFQCDEASAAGLLTMIIGRAREAGAVITAAQAEAFDDRPRGGLRGTSPAAIRAQTGDLEQACRRHGIPARFRPAADVKRWATDERLRRAGLLEVTAGMPAHARDAGRHCLYRAVHDSGVPDPLSRKVAGTPEAG
jgi:hypothetical protein